MRANAATALGTDLTGGQNHVRNRKPRPGDDPMTGADAAARRTAAAAILADFRRAASDWIDKGGPQPEWP
jgi:hypothetical protein